MLAQDSKPSMLQPSVLQPSVLLQQPGQMGPLRLETVRLIRSELPDFPMMVRLSATEYAEWRLFAR
jgi:hypothetical protein